MFLLAGAPCTWNFLEVLQVCHAWKRLFRMELSPQHSRNFIRWWKMFHLRIAEVCIWNHARLSSEETFMLLSVLSPIRRKWNTCVQLFWHYFCSQFFVFFLAFSFLFVLRSVNCLLWRLELAAGMASLQGHKGLSLENRQKGGSCVNGFFINRFMAAEGWPTGRLLKKDLLDWCHKRASEAVFVPSWRI